MKILLVEDEEDLAGSISEYLNRNDFICEKAGDIGQALEKIELYKYDCVLLDLMLPDGSGFDLLKELQNSERAEAVIIITAKDDLTSKINGFDLGADDYLTKPFHMSEMLARVHAVIRRRQFSGQKVLHFDDVEIDVLSKEVRIRGTSIVCTRKEFDLLLFLVANKNMVLSKSAIAEHLSGDMADMLDNFDFVYAHVKNLKRKLSEAGGKDHIKTIYGMGYKWES